MADTPETKSEPLPVNSKAPAESELPDGLLDAIAGGTSVPCTSAGAGTTKRNDS